MSRLPPDAADFEPDDEDDPPRFPWWAVVLVGGIAGMVLLWVLP